MREEGVRDVVAFGDEESCGLPRRISGEVDSEGEIGREGRVIVSFSPFYSNIQRRRAFPPFSWFLH